MADSNNAWHRLTRAMRQVNPADPDGAWQLIMSGTVNIGGGAVGGTGGTSMVDDTSFTPGGTSITPIGGYVGGRSIASGHAAAPAMNASGMLIVAVGAGGAGGGNAQLQVTGTDGNWLNVGYASGGDFRNVVPVSGSVNVNGTVNIGNVISNTGSVRTTGLGGSIGVLGIGGTMSAIGAGGSMSSDLMVAGTAGTYYRVGYASTNAGAWPNQDGAAWLPVMFPSGFYPTVNIGAGGGGGGGFASVAVYGSPANPVYVIGSTNIVNTVTVNLATALDKANDSITVYQGSAASLNATVLGSVQIGGPVDTANSAVRVNVVAGGAGGGVANITVRGTANTDLYVGFASQNTGAAWPNVTGAAWLPVMFPSGFYPTVNIAGGGAGGGFASVAVYGSPGMPVYAVNEVVGTNNTAYRVGYASNNLGAWPNYDGGAWLPVMFPSGFYPSVNIVGAITGSVGVTPLASYTVNMGSIPTVNLGLGTVNVGNAHGIFGSVSILGSVNIGGQPIIVDTMASLTPTGFPIAIAASGYNTFIAGPSGAPGPRTKFYSVTLISDATVDFNIQSPSGTYITGSLARLLPGAGFVVNNPIRHPVWICGSGQAATVFMYLNATAHIVGWANAYFDNI